MAGEASERLDAGEEGVATIGVEMTQGEALIVAAALELAARLPSVYDLSREATAYRRREWRRLAHAIRDQVSFTFDEGDGHS